MVVVAVETGTGPRPIQIEVSDEPDSGLPDIYGVEETRGPGRKVLKLARPLFADAVDLACTCAAEVRQRVEQMPAGARPAEFEMQFAIRMDATLGASIVATTGGAQLQVILRWRDAP
jgi:hypothetical protein